MSSSGKPSLAGAASLPPSLQLLLQKQQEHAGLQALKEASEELVARAERMAAMSTTMADGGETIGKVLQNWSYIFNLLEQVGAANPNLNTGQADRSDAGDKGKGREAVPSDEPLPMMVRLPYRGEGQDAQGGQDAQQ